MPTAPLRPCPVPYCRERLAVDERVCAKHRKVEDRARGTRSARGYDYDWQQLRKAYLNTHPVCECDDCLAVIDVDRDIAEVVDHRVPIESAPELRLVWSNLRAMSARHHNRHTARSTRFGRGSGGL